MNKDEAIEYGIKWDEAIASRGDTANSEAREFLSMAISALKSKDKRYGWIPVKSIEDIPKRGECHVTIEREIVTSIRWNENRFGYKGWDFNQDFYWCGWECEEGDEVVPDLAKKITAYMPYPEPYKKGE